MFIALHHNVTSIAQDNEYGVPLEVLRYTYGVRDSCAVFFYFLICIVMHAIIQEYILDVSAKPLRLMILCSTQFVFFVSEIQQEAASVQVQAEQVQRVWTAAGVLRHLFPLGWRHHVQVNNRK
jgi:TRAM1-like protein